MAAVNNTVDAMNTIPATITTHAATRYRRGGFSQYSGLRGGAVATGAGGTVDSGVSLIPSNMVQPGSSVKGRGHKVAMNCASPALAVERRAVGGGRSATGCGRRRDGRADRRRNLGGSAGSGARADLLGPTVGGESRAVHHRRVVLVVPVVSTGMPGGQAQPEPGEEDDRDDEHDPGNDGHPRRGLEDLGCPVFNPLGGRWWCYCGGSPCSGGVRNFAHATNDRGRTVVTAMRWLCTSCEHESDPDLAGSGLLRRRVGDDRQRPGDGTPGPGGRMPAHRLVDFD